MDQDTKVTGRTIRCTEKEHSTTRQVVKHTRGISSKINFKGLATSIVDQLRNLVALGIIKICVISMATGFDMRGILRVIENMVMESSTW